MATFFTKGGFKEEAVLTPTFEFLKFPKSIPKKHKSMADYTKKRIVRGVGLKKKKKTTKLLPKINIKKLREECVTLAKLVAKTRDQFIDQRSWQKVEKVNILNRGSQKIAYVKLNKKNPAIDVATKLGMI